MGLSQGVNNWIKVLSIQTLEFGANSFDTHLFRIHCLSMHSGFERSIFLYIFLGPRQPQVAFTSPAVLDFGFFNCLFGSLETLPLARAAMIKAPFAFGCIFEANPAVQGSFNWEGLDIGKGPEAARLDLGYFFCA